MVNGAMHAFMSSRKVSKNARMCMDGYLFVHMYVSGYWVWQTKHESIINATEMRALRIMARLPLTDKLQYSVIIRERCSVEKSTM